MLTVELCLFRTSVSVHLMEWSPDGEYFATAGKVKDQTIHKQEKNKRIRNIPHSFSFSDFSSVKLEGSYITKLA